MAHRDSFTQETIFIVAGLEILGAYLDTQKTTSLISEDNELLLQYKDKISRLSRISIAENTTCQSTTDCAIRLLRKFSEESLKQSSLLKAEANDLNSVSSKDKMRLSSALVCNGPLSFWLGRIGHPAFRDCLDQHEAVQVDDLGGTSSQMRAGQTPGHKDVLSLREIVDVAIETGQPIAAEIDDSCLDESQFGSNVVQEWSQHLATAVLDVLKSQGQRRSSADELLGKLDNLLRAHAHIVRRVNEDFHRHTDLELDASHEFELLEFKNPPALNSLQFTDGARYFLCLGEKVASGDIKIRQNQSADVTKEYHRLFESLELLDKSLAITNGVPGHDSQIEDYAKSIEANNQPSRIRSLVLSMIKVAKDLNKKHGQILKVLKVLASLGEVKYSRDGLGQLLAEGKFALPYHEVESAIEMQSDTLQNINAAYNICQNEYNRQTKGWRWFLANILGFTNDYRQTKKWKSTVGGMLGVSLGKLTSQLSDFTELVRSVNWAPGTEFSGVVCGHIESLADGFKLTRLQFTWRNDQYEQALKFACPRSISPDAAFLNALCAAASCDKEFDEIEKKKVLEIVVNKFKAVPQSEAENRIETWSKRASSQNIAESVAQAIVDLGVIKGTAFHRHMPTCLKAVVNADGKQKKSELMIYNAMMVRLFKD